MLQTLSKFKLIDGLLCLDLVAFFIYPDVLYIAPTIVIGSLKALDMVYTRDSGGKELDSLRDEIKTARADVTKLSLKLGFRS